MTATDYSLVDLELDVKFEPAKLSEPGRCQANTTGNQASTSCGGCTSIIL